MEAGASAIRTEFAPRIPMALVRFGDERLARLVAARDERAFALLYERYHQALYRYLRSMLGQDADAQDALQSTFASAFGALKAGRRSAPLRPWLFRIAHNEAISSLRRRRPDTDMADTLASPAPTPEEQVIERERLRLLVADLAELTDRQRGALVMRELSGLSHEDIACALEMSVTAAKQSVFEARRALLELEEGRAMACEEILRVISDGDKRALRGRRMRAHIRSCPACAAFGVSIQARRADLLALSPALPAAAGSALFARITGAGIGHGGGGGCLLAGATGKTVGVGVSGKAFTAGVAVLATTAVGAAGVLPQISVSHTPAGTGSRVRSIHPRSGRGAVGSPAARFGQGSVTAWSLRTHGLAVGDGVVSARSGSRDGASASAIHAAEPGTAQRRASSAPGQVVSRSAGAGGNGLAHRATGRGGGSARARAPGAGGTARSTRASAGATHEAVKPARRTPPRVQSAGSSSPHRSGVAGLGAPRALPGSHTSTAAGAPSLASSGAGLTPGRRGQSSS